MHTPKPRHPHHPTPRHPEDKKLNLKFEDVDLRFPGAVSVIVTVPDSAVLNAKERLQRHLGNTYIEEINGNPRTLRLTSNISYLIDDEQQPNSHQRFAAAHFVEMIASVAHLDLGIECVASVEDLNDPNWGHGKGFIPTVTLQVKNGDELLPYDKGDVLLKIMRARVSQHQHGLATQGYTVDPVEVLHDGSGSLAPYAKCTITGAPDYNPRSARDRANEGLMEAVIVAFSLPKNGHSMGNNK